MNLFIKYGSKFYQYGLSIPIEYLKKFKNAVIVEKADELKTPNNKQYRNNK